MCKGSYDQSALTIGTGDEEEGVVVLVVGGRGGTGKETALIRNRSHEASGNRGGQWRWQQLSPMLEERPNSPGLLLLGGERVLVCGGNCGSLFLRWLSSRCTSEILQLPRDSNEKGVWTLITQPMSRRLRATFLVKFNRRIIRVGKLLILQGNFISKRPRLTMACLHFRRGRNVR